MRFVLRDAARRHIERELADRDAHPVRPEVAQPEDAAAVLAAFAARAYRENQRVRNCVHRVRRWHA